MSLQVDDGRRGRSRSPAPRDRSRSRGPPLAVDTGPPMPYPDERDGDGPRIYDYEDRYDTYAPPRSPGPPRSPVESPSWRRSNQSLEDRYADDRRERDYRYEQEPSRSKLSEAADKLAFLPQKYAKRTESFRDGDRDTDRARDKDRNRKDKYDEDLAYGSVAAVAPSTKYAGRPEEPSYNYAQPKQWEYAKVDKQEERLTYNDRGPRDSRDSLGVDPRFASGRAPSPGPSGTREKSHYRDPFGDDPRSSGAHIVTAEPGSRSKRDASPLPPAQRSKRDASPLPPTQRMSSLSVNTGHHSLNMSLSAAPPSPLLESYHGTYQSMSPMPSPLLMPSNGGFDPRIQDVSPIGSDDERNGKTKRRARFNNPEEDAARLAKALKGDKSSPDTGPLIEILPGLTHDQLMDLRIEYKRLVKTGPERKGVNIAKHIRSRLKDEDPSLMKACYATALGQWESEAYWANFWYQGDKTRRELLIESLMGRTNDEIREIKDGFSDKKYDNSLIKCMRTELKEDKFKKAVLLVLDEKRMEERDRYGRPLPIDSLLVEDDARQLYKAVRADKGGESAMIAIVVQRSDSHLREVLKLYNLDYGGNFARDALKKSGNLVGELLAHILNGVINKPVRDALLLHHALTASKRDELRRELLISRLVRFHWDRHHMAAVKAAYRDRYGRDLQESVKDVTSGTDWGRFCRELCITRMPDDVRRVERVIKADKDSGRDRDRERERDRDRDRERDKDRRSGR